MSTTLYRYDTYAKGVVDIRQLFNLGDVLPSALVYLSLKLYTWYKLVLIIVRQMPEYDEYYSIPMCFKVNLILIAAHIPTSNLVLDCKI